MEFHDKPPNEELVVQFEIGLNQNEHELAVAAIRALAVSVMSGEAARVNRSTADSLLDYLTLDAGAQSRLTVTPAQAMRFALLLQHGAVSLHGEDQVFALAIAKSIEREVVVRKMLTDLDDIKPEDFSD